MSTRDTDVYPGRMTKTHDDLYVNRLDAAKMLGKSPRTVNRMMKDGRLSYVRNPLTGRPAILRADVQKLRPAE